MSHYLLRESHSPNPVDHQSRREEGESHSRNAVDHQSGSGSQSGSKEGESHSRNAVDHQSGSKEGGTHSQNACRPEREQARRELEAAEWKQKAGQVKSWEGEWKQAQRGSHFTFHFGRLLSVVDAKRASLWSKFSILVKNRLTKI